MTSFQILILDPAHELAESLSRNEIFAGVDYTNQEDVRDVEKHIVDNSPQLVIFHRPDMLPSIAEGLMKRYRKKNKKLTVVFVTDKPVSEHGFNGLILTTSEGWQREVATCITDFNAGDLTFRTICAAA